MKGKHRLGFLKLSIQHNRNIVHVLSLCVIPEHNSDCIIKPYLPLKSAQDRQRQILVRAYCPLLCPYLSPDLESQSPPTVITLRH